MWFLRLPNSKCLDWFLLSTSKFKSTVLLTVLNPNMKIDYDTLDTMFCVDIDVSQVWNAKHFIHFFSLN
jgi:hypothetical protein